MNDAAKLSQIEKGEFIVEKDQIKKMFINVAKGGWDNDKEETVRAILPAKDALNKTKETHLKKIESFILAAIEKGETSCEVMPKDQFISEENKQILKDAGYKVIEKESMNGTEIKISWE